MGFATLSQPNLEMFKSGRSVIRWSTSEAGFPRCPVPIRIQGRICEKQTDTQGRDPLAEGIVQECISMPDIASIANGSVGPVQRTSSPSREHDSRAVGHPTGTAGHERPDRVEVSRFASWLQALRQLPETRTDKIDSVREAIDAGGYETPEKYEHAIDGLLKDLKG